MLDFVERKELREIVVNQVAERFAVGEGRCEVVHGKVVDAADNFDPFQQNGDALTIEVFENLQLILEEHQEKRKNGMNLERKRGFFFSHSLGGVRWLRVQKRVEIGFLD